MLNTSVQQLNWDNNIKKNICVHSLVRLLTEIVIKYLNSLLHVHLYVPSEFPTLQVIQPSQQVPHLSKQRRQLNTEKIIWEIRFKTYLNNLIVFIQK